MRPPFFDAESEGIHMAFANGVNVQPNWNQTDSTAEDYIQNKPTIPEVPQAENQSDSEAEDVEGLLADFNELPITLRRFR